MSGTPIHWLNRLSGQNRIAVKRDDLFPVSFGGNKARKGVLFFEEIKKQGANCVITYGSRSSNHCRVIANLAAAAGLPCGIVTPSEEDQETANSRMVHLMGARYICCKLEEVSEIIEGTLDNLRKAGKRPYFIAGGGHGNIGTQALVEAYAEILTWEAEHDLRFDYIFLASGTGTTQAGLLCGQMMAGRLEQRIVGISIARPLPRGRDVVIQSVRDYLDSVGKADSYREELVEFETEYLCGGYGKVNDGIRETISRALCLEGLPLCGTYTGKAFWGMEQYLMTRGIKGKNVLFLHTGGTPLFFDDLKELSYEHFDSQRRDT